MPRSLIICALLVAATTRGALGQGAASTSNPAKPATGATGAAATSARTLDTPKARTVWPDEGAAKWAPRPTQAAITANDLRTRLYQISDDSMLGRKVGELGDYKATAYVAREFKRLGLKPAGDSGTYFQDLAYGPTGYDSASSRLLVGGKALVTSKAWIPMAPSPPSGIGGKADLTNVPTVFAGAWGDTAVALDSAVFKGKVAVFTGSAVEAAAVAAAGGRGARGGGRGGGGTTGAGGARLLPRCDSIPSNFGAEAAIRSAAAVAAGGAATAGAAGRGRGAGGPPGAGGRGGRGGGGGGSTLPTDARAQAAGAVGVLVVSLDSIPRATVASAFEGRMGMQPATVAAPTEGLGGAMISAAAATSIFGKPMSQLSVGAAGQPVTLSWSYGWRMSRTPARNVIAILPGSDPARAGEYVLVSAHNDHLGVNTTPVDHDSLRAFNWVVKPQGANDAACRPSPEQQHRIDSMIARARSIRPPRLDSTFNGADDDGSGTAVLLEIAEKFATEKPARSIIFVSHTGEEAGLLGSKWFTDHPTIPLDSIAAAHNMDMVGKGRTDEVKFGGPTSIQTLGSRRLSQEFGDIIDSVNAVRTETMAIDKTWDVFANPMNRFCRSDQVNYVKHNVPVTYFSLGYGPDYHQVTDEPQYIDYDHAARFARFIHDVMMAVATRKDRPAISGPDPNYPVCR